MLAGILKRPANIYINPDSVFKSFPYLASLTSPFCGGEKRQDCHCLVERGCEGTELCLSFCVPTMAESREELGSSVGLSTRLTVALCQAHVLVILPSGKELHAKIMLVIYKVKQLG